MSSGEVAVPDLKDGSQYCPQSLHDLEISSSLLWSCKLSFLAERV